MVFKHAGGLHRHNPAGKNEQIDGLGHGALSP
jgi:hypothetical protein